MSDPLRREELLIRPGRELLGPGDWSRVFGREAPLEVEVGFGRDDGLLRRAAAQKERNFIGVELKRERVDTYIGRAARSRLRNLRIVAGRAEVVIGILLPEAGVDSIRILFPDPWPKPKHEGNRLVQPYFARQLRRVLRPGGTVLLATDDAAYQEQMQSVMDGVGGFQRESVRDAAERDDEGTAARLGPGERIGTDGTTIFERKGKERGRGIRYFLYRRSAEAPCTAGATA
jgi:tRNA (guanine-N7-)-methyltransferase